MENKSNEPIYTISTAAKLLDISVYTLRMYEREGLIIPFRKDSNQRLYSELDIERVKCIKRTINEDRMTMEGMRRNLALLPCWAIVNCSLEDTQNLAGWLIIKIISVPAKIAANVKFIKVLEAVNQSKIN